HDLRQVIIGDLKFLRDPRCRRRLVRCVRKPHQNSQSIVSENGRAHEQPFKLVFTMQICPSRNWRIEYLFPRGVSNWCSGRWVVCHVDVTADGLLRMEG